MVLQLMSLYFGILATLTGMKVIVREAAIKKVPPLVARPLRGGEEGVKVGLT